MSITFQGELFPSEHPQNSQHEINQRNLEKADRINAAKKKGAKIKDLSGRRYGFLTVERATDERHHAGVVFLCRCDCGREIKLTGRHLKRKDSPTTHCGCKGVGRNGRPAPGTRGIDNSLSYVTTNPVVAFNALYAKYRHDATSRGQRWELSKRFFHSLATGDCQYCGTEPAQVFIRAIHKFTYNGIDRVDSARPYTPDNCVSCCGTCNVAKGEGTPEELRERVKRIYQYQFG